MPTIKQFKPGCISTSDNGSKAHEFNSMEELLKLDFVQHAGLVSIIQKQYFKPVNVAFHQFSKSVTNEKETLLMAEFNSGSNWLVVGYIEGGDEIIKSLPDWLPKR